MTPARFSIQAMIVLALVALVSFPEQRQARVSAFSHVAGAAGGRRDRDATPTRSPAGRSLVGYGSASEYTIGAAGASALRRKLYENDLEGRKRPTPLEVLALGGKINAIVGYARSRNAPIPFARVLLRTLSTGLVEARAIADEDGRFTFLDLIPSGYVIEILDGSGAIVGTSDVISVGLNQLRSTTVGSGGRTALASFGGGLRPAAQETIAAAAVQGVNRFAAPDRCASPPCDSFNP
jgi:hypothetical protein